MRSWVELEVTYTSEPRRQSLVRDAWDTCSNYCSTIRRASLLAGWLAGLVTGWLVWLPVWWLVWWPAWWLVWMLAWWLVWWLVR